MSIEDQSSKLKNQLISLVAELNMVVRMCDQGQPVGLIGQHAKGFLDRFTYEDKLPCEAAR